MKTRRDGLTGYPGKGANGDTHSGPQTLRREEPGEIIPFDPRFVIRVIIPLLVAIGMVAVLTVIVVHYPEIVKGPGVVVNVDAKQRIITVEMEATAGVPDKIGVGAAVRLLVADSSQMGNGTYKGVIKWLSPARTGSRRRMEVQLEPDHGESPAKGHDRLVSGTRADVVFVVLDMPLIRRILYRSPHSRG